MHGGGAAATAESGGGDKSAGAAGAAAALTAAAEEADPDNLAPSNGFKVKLVMQCNEFVKVVNIPGDRRYSDTDKTRLPGYYWIRTRVFLARPLRTLALLVRAPCLHCGTRARLLVSDARRL